MDSDVMKAAREAIALLGIDEARKEVSGMIDGYYLDIFLAGIEAATQPADADSEPRIINLGDALKRSVAEAEAKRSQPAEAEAPSDAEIEALLDDHKRAMLDNAVCDTDTQRGETRRRARQAFDRLLGLMRRNRQPADELFLSSQVAKLRAERDRAVEALRGLQGELTAARSAIRALHTEIAQQQPCDDASLPQLVDGFGRAVREEIQVHVEALRGLVEAVDDFNQFGDKNAVLRRMAEALRAAKEVLRG